MKIAAFKVNQLGDNVVFLPVIQALRKHYPDWSIFLLTSPVAAQLFGADLGPGEMLTFPTKDFNGAWRHPARLARLAAALWREQCEASLVAPDQGNVAHLLALWAGGNVRVGVPADFIKVPGGLTCPVELRPEISIAQTNWELARVLVRQLGGTFWPDSPPTPDLSRMYGAAVPQAGRVIIHPGASLPYKRWSPERFQALAARLCRDFEVIWIEQPEIPAPELPPSVRRVSPGALTDFVALLRTACLLVANNSGPMHLASAVGCPALIISGPSSPIWDPIWYRERFRILRDTSLACLPCDRPLRPVWECQNLASPLACMAAWSVDQVHEEAVRWLARWTPEITRPG